MSSVFKIQNQSSEADLRALISQACDCMEEIYAGGHYPGLLVHRRWSHHNPSISGEIARPSTFRWYLSRELYKLARKGAEIEIGANRERIDLSSPSLFEAVDEIDFDITQKKLFLFSPERIDLSIERLEHYTGTSVDHFQRFVLLTNYGMHMEAFRELYPDCETSAHDGVQMPAHHHVEPENSGLSIINIGVGPSNAKTLTDHIAVLRPDAMVMVGHCGGIRNHQEIGDFVLASGYMRADHVLDNSLPLSVPVSPSFLLNLYLAKILDEEKLNYRTGTVYTTADRNWELAVTRTLEDLRASRSLAIDMESATVAANGFRYRVPNATLLCVSDKPLHGKPKLPREAKHFYRETQHKHITIAIRALENAKRDWPQGLPNSDIRALDEPLMGGHAD